MQKATIQWNCKQIAKMVENGSIVFDNAIQRGFVWDKKRMVKLIDSILRGYPIPPFYTVKDGRTIKTPKGNVSVYDCFEGKQRSLTITKFKNDEFVLNDLDPIVCDNGETTDLNGLKYSELPDDLRDAFDSYSLTVYFFTDVDEDEISEIMSRLNNGQPLSVVENTRIKAKDLAGIQRLAQHPFLISTLTEREINRYINEDVVVKSVIMLRNPKGSLDNAVVRPLFCELEITKDLEKQLTETYDYMAKVYEILAQGKKKPYNNCRKRTQLISLIPIIRRAINDKQEPEDVADLLIQLFGGDGTPTDDEDYNVATKSGSTHAENVETRNKFLNENYDWYFSSKK